MSTHTHRLFNVLKNFDLTDEDIWIYLFLFENDRKSALEISKRLNIPRTTVYFTINRLSKLNLARAIGPKRGQRFEALPYSNLEDLVKTKKEEAENLERCLPQLFAQFESIEAAKSRQSRIVNYSGELAYKQILYNTAKAQTPIRIFEKHSKSVNLTYKELEILKLQYKKQRIDTLLLITNDKEPNFEFGSNKETLVQRKTLSSKAYKVTSNMIIYNNVVALISNDLSYAMEIYSQENANALCSLFDFVWSNSR